MPLTERAKREVLNTIEGIESRLDRRLDTLCIQLFDLQSEVDALVAIKTIIPALRAYIELDSEKSPPPPDFGQPSSERKTDS